MDCQYIGRSRRKRACRKERAGKGAPERARRKGRAGKSAPERARRKERAGKGAPERARRKGRAGNGGNGACKARGAGARAKSARDSKSISSERREGAGAQSAPSAIVRTLSARSRRA